MKHILSTPLLNKLFIKNQSIPQKVTFTFFCLLSLLMEFQAVFCDVFIVHAHITMMMEIRLTSQLITNNQKKTILVDPYKLHNFTVFSEGK